MNVKQPLGLPAGSVRAILALLLILAVVVIAAALVFQGKLSADKWFLGVLGLGSTVTTSYFATRPASPTNGS